MSSSTQTVIECIILIISAFIVTRTIMGWLQGRACTQVIKDLEKQKARDVASAVPLPYAKPKFIRFGLRDYRPTAVRILQESDVVGKTKKDTYYLKDGYTSFVFKDRLFPWNK